jgi:hypothetical protein
MLSTILKIGFVYNNPRKSVALNTGRTVLTMAAPLPTVPLQSDNAPRRVAPKRRWSVEPMLKAMHHEYLRGDNPCPSIAAYDRRSLGGVPVAAAMSEVFFGYDDARRWVPANNRWSLGGIAMSSFL